MEGFHSTSCVISSLLSFLEYCNNFKAVSIYPYSLLTPYLCSQLLPYNSSKHHYKISLSFCESSQASHCLQNKVPIPFRLAFHNQISVWDLSYPHLHRSLLKLYYNHCSWIFNVMTISWRRKWQLTPVFLPGKCSGQRSLVGYSPWDCKRVRHDLVTKQQATKRSSKGSSCLVYIRVMKRGETASLVVQW